jgi:hypothetical protein
VTHVLLELETQQVLASNALKWRTHEQMKAELPVLDLVLSNKHKDLAC